MQKNINKFPKSGKFDKAFVSTKMMGPNCLKILEEMTDCLYLRPGMRVLDLGCGTGLTSIFLAREFGVQVFATDLWISASENYETFSSFGLTDQIIPIHADANDLPYANEYFDAVISVDSYHYYGTGSEFTRDKLAPLVKPGGIIAIAVPGVKRDLDDYIPPEFPTEWREDEEVMTKFKTHEFWLNNFEFAEAFRSVTAREMDCCDEAWNDWLSCDNPYAVPDRKHFAAGAGKHLNLISITAYKN